MLLRQTILYLPAQVVGPVFQLLSVVVWTHFLSPAELGVFALVTAAQELAYTATLFWFGLYTARYFDPSAPDYSRRGYLDTETGVMIFAGLSTLLIVLALPLVVDARWTLGLAASTFAYMASRALVNQLSDRARTSHDTISYSLLQIIWPVLGLLVGLVLVTVLEPTAASVLWGYAGAQVMAVAIAVVRLGLGRAPWRASREMVRKALRYGVPLVAGGVLVWVAANGIRFVVEWKEGAAAVGLITVGWGLGLRAATFAAMLVTAASFPIAVKRAREEGIDAGQAQLVKNGVLLLAALAPAAAGLWAIADPLVRLVIAGPYQEMTISILPLSILAGTVRSFRLHFGEQIFLLREETLVPLVNDGVDAVIAMIGTAIGLYLGGLPGAVAGAACGAGAALALTLWCGWRWHGFRLPLSDLLRIIGASALMTTVVVCLPLQPSVLILLLAVAAGAASYAIALAALYPEQARNAWALVHGMLTGEKGAG